MSVVIVKFHLVFNDMLVEMFKFITVKINTYIIQPDVF